MSRCRTRSKAFTFIEVLIALTIASIALLGLLRLHLLSLATADAAQATTQAVFVAQAQIAEASTAGFPRQGTTSGTLERNGQHYAWETKVRDVTGPDGSRLALSGLREVSTTVTWKQASDEKTMTMTTYVADTRIHDRTAQ
jgi:type II secretion system protein I